MSCLGLRCHAVSRIKMLLHNKARTVSTVVGIAVAFF